MPVFLPRRWNRQPSYSAGVDWNNPLTQNIRNLWNMSQRGMVDAVGNANGTPIGGVGLAGSADGLASTFDSAGTTYVDLPRPAQFNLASGSRWTLLFRIATTTDTAQALWNYGDGTANNRCALFVGNAVTGTLTDELITWARSISNTLTPIMAFQTASRSLLVDGAWHTVMITSNGSACAIWLDGISRTVTLASGSTNNGRIDITGTATTATLGVQNTGTIGGKFNGSMSLGAFWAGDMSQFAMELHQRPWQLFRPAANQTFYSLPSPSQTAGTPQLGLWGDLPWAGLPAAGSVTQTLTPDRYDNANSFYSPTVTAGAVTLTPSRYDNAQTFYTPTVTRGAVTLTPNRYDNTSAFYTPTVTSSITLVPGRYDNAQTFYSPTVTVAGGLFPARYDNAQTFYTPTVTRGSVTLTPALFTQTSSYFSPTVTRGTITLTPSLYTNTSSFYAPVVTQGGAVLQPARYDNANTFYSPTVDVTDFDTEVRLTNNAEASLASGVSTLDTVIVVQNTEGAVFPDLGTVGYFYATLTDAIGNYEIVKVSTRINDTMTVVRGQEGTLPIPFAAGSRFQILTTVGNSLAQFSDLDYLLF